MYLSTAYLSIRPPTYTYDLIWNFQMGNGIWNVYEYGTDLDLENITTFTDCLVRI
jgi:hypothetical protein